MSFKLDRSLKVLSIIFLLAGLFLYGDYGYDNYVLSVTFDSMIFIYCAIAILLWNTKVEVNWAKE